MISHQIGTATVLLITFLLENCNAFLSLSPSPYKNVIHHQIQSVNTFLQPQIIDLTRKYHYPSSKSALLAVEYEKDIESDSDEDSHDVSLSNENVGKAILSLAIPALASLAIDPLMTLADTAFIGRTADDSSALAGVGSAAALLTFSFYIFNFLCTVTTPLVSKKRAAKDTAGALEVGSQALSLAIILGFMLSIVLIAFSQPLLLVMGTGSTGLEANTYATSFLTIRALAAPAVFVSSASTGILRGYLDTKTSLVLIAAANVINFILDVILIGVLHMGPTGAAIATTTAEWLCALYFMFVLAGKAPSADGKLGNNQQYRKGFQPETSYTQLDGPEFLVVTPTLVLPPWGNIKPLIVAASSVFVRSFMLQLSIAGAAVAAARSSDSIGTITEHSASASIAAHQIALQIWLLCSFICDALAAASQTLVADGLGKSDQTGVRNVSRKIFTYSIFLGIVLVGCLELGEISGVLLDFFTTDEATQAALKPLLAILIFAQPLNSFVFAADGVIQGASEFEFQAKSMILSASVAMVSFFVLHHLGDPSDSLKYIWYSLVILQVMRGITSLIKLVDKEGPIDLLGKKI